MSGIVKFSAAVMLLFTPYFISGLYGDSPEWSTSAIGPLSGRNMYAPYVPWLSFCADKAAAEPKGRLIIKSNIYLINDFGTYPFDPDDYTLSSDGKLSAEDQKGLLSVDYESTVIETGAEWQAFENVRFSADWRLHFRYSGFMDPFINWWHDLLNVPDAGRSYFYDNRSYWNIIDKSGNSLSGEGFTVSPGDIDLSANWTFFENRKIALSLKGAFKIPFGAVGNGVEEGFSSGFPDLAMQFNLDWYPWKRWAFYLNSSVVFPLGGTADIMGQFIPAVEFRAAENFSIVTQMNIQTAPFSGNADYRHPFFGNSTMFALPQTDIKIGIKGRLELFSWQLYIEEDPLTWEGPDILVYMGADWNIR